MRHETGRADAAIGLAIDQDAAPGCVHLDQAGIADDRALFNGHLQAASVGVRDEFLREAAISEVGDFLFLGKTPRLRGAESLGAGNLQLTLKFSQGLV